MRLARWAVSLFIASAAVAGAVLAHVALKASNIGAGAVIDTLPAEFSLAFSQPVGLIAFSLEAGDGAQVSLEYIPPRDRRAEFAIPLPRLAPGVYTAKWRTISNDGHVLTDELSFTLSAPATP